MPPPVPPKPARSGKGSQIADRPAQLHDNEVYIPSPEGSDDEPAPAQKTTPPKHGSRIERDSSPTTVVRKEKKEKKVRARAVCECGVDV